MNPAEKIALLYAEFPQEEGFQTYLNWHVLNGYVFSTPEYFLMGRGANRNQLLRDGEPKLEVLAHPDCWYVHAMSGDIEKAWQHLPYPLPWLAFERIRNGKRELQILPTARLQELSHAIPSPS